MKRETLHLLLTMLVVSIALCLTFRGDTNDVGNIVGLTITILVVSLVIYNAVVRPIRYAIRRAIAIGEVKEALRKDNWRFDFDTFRFSDDLDIKTLQLDVIHQHYLNQPDNEAYLEARFGGPTSKVIAAEPSVEPSPSASLPLGSAVVGGVALDPWAAIALKEAKKAKLIEDTAIKFFTRDLNERGTHFARVDELIKSGKYNLVKQGYRDGGYYWELHRRDIV